MASPAARTEQPSQISTDRLLLRPLDQTHAPVVLAYFVRNKTFRQSWSPDVPADFLTLERQTERLASDMAQRQAGQAVRLWLFHCGDTNLSQAMGYVAVSNIVRGAFQSCHFGYEIDGRAKMQNAPVCCGEQMSYEKQVCI